VLKTDELDVKFHGILKDMRRVKQLCDQGELNGVHSAEGRSKVRLYSWIQRSQFGVEYS
jgi:hypothetical protein